MNLGYHHHVPSVFESPDHVRVPAHFGMFTEELAKQAGSVTYYTYETSPTGIEDYPLVAPRVRCVNLGPRPPAPIQLLRPGPILRRIDFARDGIDALLVRGPGPLLPALLRHATVPSAALIVGDYRSWSPNVANAAWRNRAISLFQRVYRRLQGSALRRTLTMTQNPWLLEHGAGSPFAHGRVVFTSSITEEMIRSIDARSGVGGGPSGDERKRVLYTGRLVQEKGVLLVVEALGLLVGRGFDVEVEFVGWAPGNDPTPMLIGELASSLNIADRVKQTGFRTAAAGLIDCYLAADVYVFASPTEWGSSHTITEAMVARVPVVTSGFEGIRGVLTDGEQAVIVEPGSAAALADGLERVLSDRQLRQRLRHEGRRWAETRTNELSVTAVLDCLTDWVDLQSGANGSDV